jgi:hypothetical protein
MLLVKRRRRKATNRGLDCLRDFYVTGSSGSEHHSFHHIRHQSLLNWNRTYQVTDVDDQEFVVTVIERFFSLSSFLVEMKRSPPTHMIVKNFK